MAPAPAEPGDQGCDLLDRRLRQDGFKILELVSAVLAVRKVEIEHPPEQLGPTPQLSRLEPALQQCPLLADGRRPTFRTARCKPDGQDMGLNVSKVASDSPCGVLGLGHKRALAADRFGERQFQFQDPVSTHGTSPP